MARPIYIRNVTSSGISIPDLSGMKIAAGATRDLREFFTIDDIDYSEDLQILISGGQAVLNDGDRDLTTTESYDLSQLPTFYDIVDQFTDLVDTPTTYSGSAGKYVAVTTTESGLEFVDAPGAGGVEVIAWGVEESLMTTTSTSWREVLSLNTPSLPAGDYLIMWYYEWQYKHGSFYFKGRVQVDDADIVMDHYQQPANVYDWPDRSGFKRVTLTTGVHNIDIDYCGTKSGKTAKIRNIRLELWRA